MNSFSSVGCASWTLVDGSMVLSEKAVASVFDRSFLYGDAIFETMACHHGRIFRVSDHWQRLVRSAEVLRLKLPFRDESDFITRCSEILSKNALDDATIRVTVSRGVGPRSLGISGCLSPFWVIACYPRIRLSRNLQEGRTLHLSSIRRVSPQSLPTSAKTVNYLNNILSYVEAVEEGADDALLLSTDGFLAECASSNIFFVWNDILRTPALQTGALPGITRRVVFEIAAKHAIKTTEECMDIRILDEASEVFISNSASGIVPISKIGDYYFTTPGPLTKAIFKGYYELVHSV